MRARRFALAAVVGFALFPLPSSASPGCGLDSWTSQAGPTPQWLRDVAFGDGKFVAVGDNGSIFTSPDGAKWTRVPASPADYYASVTFANGQFLLTGRRFVAYPTAWDGIILSSSDALHWTEVFRRPDLVVFDVAWGGGKFVAVAGALVASPVVHTAQVLTSADGNQWETADLGPGFWPYSIAYGNGRFAGVGGTRVFTSNDGANWTVTAASPGRSFSVIAFGGGIFVAAGGAGAVVTSANGADWVARTAIISENLGALTYGAGGFVAGGNAGRVVSSSDGVNWTVRNSSGPDLRGITFGADRFVAVGRLATLQSGVLPGGSPTILVQSPATITTTEGQPVSLTVEVCSALPVIYQWLKNGLAVPGANGPTLSFPSVTVADSGDYLLVASNTEGGAVSRISRLYVQPGSGNAPRLSLRFETTPEIMLWGAVGQAHRIEFADDPAAANWQVLTTLPALPSSPFTVLDTEAAGATRRFYRAVLLP